MFGPTCQRWDEWGTAWDSRLLFAGFLPCGRVFSLMLSLCPTGGFYSNFIFACCRKTA
jgi:hypothetical protein